MYTVKTMTKTLIPPYESIAVIKRAPYTAFLLPNHRPIILENAETSSVSSITFPNNAFVTKTKKYFARKLANAIEYEL